MRLHRGAVLVAFAFLAAGCSPGASSPTETAPAESVAASEAAEVVAELPIDSVSDWVLWDEATCSFKPTDTHPDTWTATIRKVESPMKFGFATQSESLASVLTQANDQLKSLAADAGIELVFGNNDVLGPESNTRPIAEAERIAETNPDVFGSFNVLEGINAAVQKPFQDLCIPIVQVEFQSPNAVFVGPDNQADGAAAGNYMADYAKEQGWAPEDILVVGATQGGVPENLVARMTDCLGAAQAALPGASVKEFSVGDQGAASTLTNFTDFLTANPDEHHMLVCTMADLFADAIANAFKNQNRPNDGIVTGHLATDEGLAVIRQGGSPFVATVDYGFRDQPAIAMAVAQDIAEGKPVPLVVHGAIVVYDASNIDEAPE